ncbi:TetR family transcriptional regulator [Streptomyces sp. NPDC020875]|uniref:TetR/AcrR family transcriptional regulator n=1 Tax=Streptomyces sp. NPDC020875 TaxID=3154898 RepID=UPI0033C5D522
MGQAGAGARAGAGTAERQGKGGEAGSGAEGEWSPGLRELKKERTRRALSDTAIALFVERGFDAVPVTEIAAAAGVSKPTLFRYFPAKEDLVLYRFADHEGEPARVVAAARRAGVPPLEALRRHVRAGVERSDPVTGLGDAPEIPAFLRLLYGTPGLVARLYAYQCRSEESLAAALGAGPGARQAAAQIVAVLRVLAEENGRRIAAGESVAAIRPDALAAVDAAFARLRDGLGDGSGDEPVRPEPSELSDPSEWAESPEP